MNIFYSCDNNYVWLMGVSLVSLFENNKDIKELDVFLLGKDISDSNKEKLNDIALKYNRNVSVIDVQKINIPEELATARWPISAFMRLFAAELLPQDIDRILYLDCDIIIQDNISDLDKIEFGQNLIYGVKECNSPKYRRNLDIKEDDNYINAGVFLMNLKELRKIDINAKLKDYISKYANFISFADQDILNGIFNKKIGIMDIKYNFTTVYGVFPYTDVMILRKPTFFYTENEFNEAKKNPVIIHYTTNLRTVRPWFRNSDHPYLNQFKKHLEMSPWKDEELKEFKFNTKESKIIGIIQKLPTKLSYYILGWIHANLKPDIVYIKAKLKRK